MCTKQNKNIKTKSTIFFTLMSSSSCGSILLGFTAKYVLTISTQLIYASHIPRCRGHRMDCAAVVAASYRCLGKAGHHWGTRRCIIMGWSHNVVDWSSDDVSTVVSCLDSQWHQRGTIVTPTCYHRYTVVIDVTDSWHRHYTVVTG